jgi:RNA polymerase sigma-70 factor (ECF subfamily)
MTPATLPDCSASSDDQLLACHARGERSALDELFRRHRWSAYRVALRHLGQDADALDAVQQGFVKAFRHLGGFQHRSSFRTWLLRIIANTALDLRRQRQRRRMASLDASWLRDHEHLHPVLSGNPARNLETAELKRGLEDAIAALPEPHRQTFVLHVQRGLTYAEVAKILHIPIGTVMSRIHHARRKVQSYLAALEEPAGSRG